jgi:hypothetical protein
MTFDAILDDFDKWAAGDGRRDRGAVLTALELSRDYLEHDEPGQFLAGDVAALLMEAYPQETVLETAADAVAVVRAVRNLLAFLSETARLPANLAQVLRDELDDTEADFIQATVDGDFGRSGADPLVDMIAELGFPTDVLPPIRLPDAGELLAAARQSPVLAEIKDVLDGRADGSDELTDMITMGELTPDLWAGDDEEFLARVWAPVFLMLANHPDVEDRGIGPYALLFLTRGKGVELGLFDENADLWRAWAERLARHNAVTVEDDVARFTPLALTVVREQLLDSGVRIDLLPAPAEMAAEDLVAAAPGFTVDERAAEMSAWLATRAPVDAAGELLAAAAGGDALERVWVTSTVTSLGSAAQPAWTAALADEVLAPYAKLALGTDAPTVPERAWLATDALVVALLDNGPDELAATMRTTLPDGDVEALLEAMWRLPHPDVADVLELVGQHHPDKRVAKSARRVAHKATTRQG